jgi:hypothetical protein
MKIQVDIDGSISGEAGKVLAWGRVLSGVGVIEVDNLPNDIDEVRYKYIDGEFIAQPNEEVDV